MSKKYEDPAYWDRNCLAWGNHAMPVLDQYVRYARWFRGEMGDIERRLSGQLPRGSRKTLVCLLNLVVRSSRADLFYRSPRFFVRPPGTLNTRVFTDELAHTETLGLNHTVQEVGIYRQGRKMLLDGLLGPFMVGKVGYSAEIAPDDTLIDEQREVANIENQKFVTAGVRMKVKEDDLDSVHVEQHDQLIALVERGVQTMDKKSLDYLKKHNAKHQERIDKGIGRSKETIRNDSVFFRRKSPLNYFQDPWHDDLEDREWMGERFIARIEDIQNDKNFSAKARESVTTVSQKWLAKNGLPPLPSESLMTPDEYTLCYEMVDLVHNKVILLAHGASVPLLVKDYTLKEILPSGPYIVSSFMEDPLEDYGIPPPAVYEAHQLAAAFIASVNTQAVKRSLPKLIYDSTNIGPAEIEEIKRGMVAGLIPVKNLGQDKKISDVFFQAPTAEIPRQNNESLAWHTNMIQQISGQGSQKLLGGDTSGSATSAAMTGESAGSLAEDNAAVVDDMLGTVGRYLVRLKRRFYSKYRIAEEVGEDALDSWPDEWANRDIVNDRGVLLVPGSSRRQNSALEQKNLIELYGIMVQDPTADPVMKLEVQERLFESMGQYGFDFNRLKENARMQAQMQAALMAGGMGGEPGAEGGEPGAPGAAQEGPGSRPARRAAAGSEDQAGASQGAANVGGGRLLTGASKGDRTRGFRQSSLKRQARA